MISHIYTYSSFYENKISGGSEKGIEWYSDTIGNKQLSVNDINKISLFLSMYTSRDSKEKNNKMVLYTSSAGGLLALNYLNNNENIYK